jgi:hypothetical protein
MEIGFEHANEKSWIQWRLRHGYEFVPSNVGGTRVRSIYLLKSSPKTKHKKHAGQRSKQSTLHNRFIIAQFFNWQYTLLTSKVDGNMPLRGGVNILEEIFTQLQDQDKHLGYIPIERTIMKDRTKKSYGKSLTYDEIRSIMG